MEDSDSPLAMAAAMGLPVTASLGPVGPLLRQLHSPTKCEIQSLTGDLDRLCISLMNHSEAEKPSYRAKSWMSEIRELCYDTKNYMDDAPFLLKQDEDDQLTAQEELTPDEKQEIAMLRFKALEDRVTDASKRRERYEIDLQNINKAKFLSVARRRLPVLHPEPIGHGRLMDDLAKMLKGTENHLKGAKSINDLAKKLKGTAEEKHLKVVSLVGPEGVGKTTLAKRLHNKTGGEFQCRAFVRVSPNPDMRRLLTSIFTQIQLPGSSECVSNSKPSCSFDAQVLITKIQQYLRDKRYLIIIDDLWSISVWDIIRSAFPDGGPESRIITTTQSEYVASACCSYKAKYIFKMEPLEDDQSRKLLFSMVFASKDYAGCFEDFVSVSDEIISKCGGLPLLIVNMSSLLPTPSELNHQQWKDIRDFLPSPMKTNPTSEGVKEVLNLLYNNLSPELKTCLLYLAVYPEGYTVDKNDLVKQWATEGFTGEEQNREEIAGEYFDELVSRGMIQVVDINYQGVLSCTLHHMVHDLIVKKSMEGNFVIGVDNFQSAVWLPNKVRRLSVQFGGARSARLPAGIMLSEVRSLAFFGFYGCADFIEKCKLLRVLTLHVWADDCVHQSKERLGISPSREKNVLTYDLSGISKLLALRYLKIACNIAVKLPDEIEALQYLETLEVDATVVAIPSSVEGLRGLSSLNIAVRELSMQDIYILQALPALKALSLHLWTTPLQLIVFRKGEFAVLKYFKFRCSVPWLKFEAGSMPNLQNLDLCFNAHEADQQGIVPIGIEHLSGLEEITANIWSADTDVGSTFRTAVSNHPSSPRINVQLVDPIFHGEEEKKQAADSRMSTLQGSPSRVPIPGFSGKELQDPAQYLMEKMSSSHAQPINLHILKQCTQDFSENVRIGSGGYGAVYKGVLNGDEIAVKKLFPVPGLDDDAFDKEFRNLKKVQHKNVIRMIGYCYEITNREVEYEGKFVWSQVIDRALCFEYMKEGSLAKHISDESCKLDWPITYKIIEGTCEGLHYLHKGRGENNYIYHLDLKPDNILLDENFVPKIGDFGLSKLFGDSRTHKTSMTKGTRGFMPPEYINHNKVTPKNDVFSLGVIIFYMLVGKQRYGDYRDLLLRQNYSSKICPEFFKDVLEYWEEKMKETMGYRWDKTDVLGVTTCIEIAMRCVHNDRDHRPSTSVIIEELKKLDAQIEKILEKDPKPHMGVVSFEELIEMEICDNE